MDPGARRDDSGKTFAVELNSTIVDIVDDYSIGSHGLLFPGTIQTNRPRHQRPAGPARLRAGAVCLSGQPFPQPRARQYFDGCAGHRRQLSHRVLAVPAGRDRVLYRRAGPRRARDLGALRAPAISLEGDRAAAARAGLEHSRADHRPHRRRAARLYAVRTREALSAGAVRLLGRMAVQDLDDVRGAADRLDSRLHRSLLLAAHESVLQARGAVSARRGGAGSDAGHARPLSGRTKRHGRDRQ